MCKKFPLLLSSTRAGRLSSSCISENLSTLRGCVVRRSFRVKGAMVGGGWTGNSLIILPQRNQSSEISIFSVDPRNKIKFFAYLYETIRRIKLVPPPLKLVPLNNLPIPNTPSSSYTFHAFQLSLAFFFFHHKHAMP